MSSAALEQQGPVIFDVYSLDLEQRGRNQKKSYRRAWSSTGHQESAEKGITQIILFSRPLPSLRSASICNGARAKWIGAFLVLVCF